MGSRYNLQLELESLLGSTNVYFQPPASLRILYPAIVYKIDKRDTDHADDINYFKYRRYSLTYIHLDPDDSFPEELLDHFQMIRHDRTYTSDDLNHDVFSLYY